MAIKEEELLALITGITGGVKDIAVPYFVNRHKQRLDIENKRAEVELEQQNRLALVEAEKQAKIDIFKEQIESGGLRPEYDIQGNLLGYRLVGQGKFVSPSKQEKTTEELESERLAKEQEAKRLIEFKEQQKRETGEINLKKEKEEQKITDEIALDNSFHSLDAMKRKALEIMRDKDLPFAVGVTDISQIKSTGGRRVFSLIENLKSKIAIDEITNLKNQTKTGASGFGALSETELDVIQNAKESFNTGQKPDDFRAAVQRFVAEIEQTKQLKRNGFKKRYGAEPSLSEIKQENQNQDIKIDQSILNDIQRQLPSGTKIKSIKRVR